MKASGKSGCTPFFINNKMKRLIVIACVALYASSQIKAQYYNPYMNPQSMQSAYEWGKKMAEKYQAEQEAADKKTIGGCVSRVIKSINKDRLDDAEEWADNLRDLDEGLGCWYLGIINELQDYPQSAKTFYLNGISAGHKGCQQLLSRLNSEGEMTLEQKKQVRINFKNLELNTAIAAKRMTDEIWSGFTSTERTVYDKVSCPKCRGKKYVSTPSRYSASADSYHWSGGQGCSYCNAEYDHYHYHCHYCNPDGTIDKRR